MITFWRMLRIQQLNCTFSLGHAMAINMQWSISQSSSVDHHRVPELGGVNQHRIRTSLTSRESFVHPVRGRAFRPRPRMPGVWQDLKVLKPTKLRPVVFHWKDMGALEVDLRAVAVVVFLFGATRN